MGTVLDLEGKTSLRKPSVLQKWEDRREVKWMLRTKLFALAEIHRDPLWDPLGLICTFLYSL